MKSFQNLLNNKIKLSKLLDNDTLTVYKKYIYYGGNMKSCIKFLSFTLLFLFLSMSKAWSEKVTVITPYLAQPGTQMYVEGFKEEASKRGWDLNVIDT